MKGSKNRLRLTPHAPLQTVSLQVRDYQVTARVRSILPATQRVASMAKLPLR